MITPKKTPARFNSGGKMESLYTTKYDLLNRNQFGEFYTPPEIAQLLTRILLTKNPDIQTVYDPTCGHGSLLANFAFCTNHKIVAYGQDIQTDVVAKCRQNLSNLNIKHDIQAGDLFLAPKHTNLSFDAVISNPPYSTKWPGKDDPTLPFQKRFSQTAPAPKTKADFAFILHGLHQLNDKGVAGFVVFPGILYRGGTEKTIRQDLVAEGLVDAIIHLPPNLLKATSIGVCLMILQKNRLNKNVVFIDAQKDFKKDGNKNRLINSDRILDAVMQRRPIKNYCHVAHSDEIAQKEYILNVNRYVEIQTDQPKIDIKKLNQEVIEMHKKQRKTMKKWEKMIVWAETGFDDDQEPKFVKKKRGIEFFLANKV